MTELSKRGVISALICSGPFMKLGKAQAATFGVPNLPLVEIPHPLGGLALERVRMRAEAAASQLVHLIKEHLQ